MNKNNVIIFALVIISFAGNCPTTLQAMEQCTLSEANTSNIIALHQSLQPLLNQLMPAMQSQLDLPTLQAITVLASPTNILDYDTSHLLMDLKRTTMALNNFRTFIVTITAHQQASTYFQNPIQQGVYDQKLVEASNIMQQIYDTIINACQLSPEEKQSLNSIQ
jgi:hypothetical protein